MKTRLSLGWWLLALLAAAIPASGEQLQSLQAQFIQEKQTPLLNKPLRSSGIFAFQPPQSLRWEYRQPLASVLLLHNGATAKYLLRDGRYVPDAGANLGAMQVILPEITNWLGGRFTDNPLFTVDRSNDRTVILTPRDDGLAAIIASVELTLAATDGLLDAVTIHESADTSTRLTFSEIRLNQPLATAYFQTP